MKKNNLIKTVFSQEDISAFKFEHSFMLDSLMDSLNGMAYCNLYDQYWTMLFVSKGANKLTGYLPEEIMHNKIISYEDITHEDDRLRVRNEIDSAVISGSTFELEYRIRQADGNVIWVLERGKPIYDDKGNIFALEGYIQNITKRKDYEYALRDAEFQYRSIFENSIIGIFRTTREGKYLIANPALVSTYGYESSSEMILTLNDIKQQLYVLPNRRDEFVDLMASDGYVSNFESQVYKKNGTIIWISENARAVHDDTGQFIYYEGTVQDITEQYATKEALLRSENAAKLSLQELIHQKYALDTHSIVAVTDTNGSITHVNNKFCEISGYSREELIGNDHAIINSGHHPKDFFKEMYRKLRIGESWSAEVCNRAKNGTLYWQDTTVVPFMSEDGAPKNYISICTDITKRKEAEAQSHHLAFYDYLTNLPNRRLLIDRLNQAIISCARSNNHAALLFLDLDNFKQVNDALGHNIGDKLLQQVAIRLTDCIREGDTIARIGGDEFVLLLEDLSENAVESAAQVEYIGRKITSMLNKPYKIGLHECYSTPSIGVVVFKEQVNTEAELLKNADIAMYQAKKSGRNRLVFFDPHMQEVINHRAKLESELRNALAKQEFQLQYQIQVDDTGRALGAEALIRWTHPQRGVISPIEFIPLAEETGLIMDIGQWVLDAACQQLAAWKSHTATNNLVLAINVSVKQFRQANFVTQVQEALRRYNINPALLKLELTESLLADDIKSIVTTMNALQATGIKLSLDDFGTGYSSLQYLKMLPINQLKIDQSFVRDIANNNSDKAIALTIITLANSLGLEVIAEGVETIEQKELLLHNGCSMYQGYYFSKPVSINMFESLL